MKINDLTMQQLDAKVAQFEYVLPGSSYPAYHNDMKATGLLLEHFKVEIGWSDECYANIYDRELDAIPGYAGDTRIGEGSGPTWVIAVLRAYLNMKLKGDNV